MNTTILKKCLTELSQETPKLDYVRGMLETLIEIQPDMAVVVKEDGTASTFPMSQIHTNKVPQDEASLLDAKARAALETIKAMNTEA